MIGAEAQQITVFQQDRFRTGFARQRGVSRQVTPFPMVGTLSFGRTRL